MQETESIQPHKDDAGASANDRSVQAQRLMKKLQDCDQTLSLLLTQAADSLEAIVDQAGVEQGAPADLSAFEEISQDWLANIYDIQLTLRKAIRFLVRSKHPPILTASHAFVHGGGVSAATAGSAARVRGQDDSSEGPAMLSMSALRLKAQVWQETLEALQEFETHRAAM